MGFSRKDSGRLAGHITVWHLFPPSGLSQIPPISFIRHIMGRHPLLFGLSQILPVSFHASYRDLLLWDFSFKWLLSRLVKVGGFGQWFPNTMTKVFELSRNKLVDKYQKANRKCSGWWNLSIQTKLGCGKHQDGLWLSICPILVQRVAIISMLQFHQNF